MYRRGAVFDHRDVNVNDITAFEQFVVAGDAVTDHLVDGDAGGPGKAGAAGSGAVIEWCRDRLLNIDDVVMTPLIELTGGDAGLHKRLNHFQNVGGKTARDAHLCHVFGGFNGYFHCLFKPVVKGQKLLIRILSESLDEALTLRVIAFYSLPAARKS